MFLKLTNHQREKIVLNTNSIETILQQTDGDIFITTVTGAHHKVLGSLEEIVEKLAEECQ